MAAEDDAGTKPLCFAIMPITTPLEVMDKYHNDPIHFIRIARHVFKPAVEAAGFEFLAPASTSSEIIPAEIIANLEKADLVLCDISHWNANVFFELGIRVALDRPVVMVKDSLTDKIPFDTAMLNCYTYDCSLDITCVEAEVPNLAEHVRNAKGQTQNALWRYFGITQRAERSDPGNPEDAKLDLILARLATMEQHTTINGLPRGSDRLHDRRRSRLNREIARLAQIVDTLMWVENYDSLSKTVHVMTRPSDELSEEARAEMNSMILDATTRILDPNYRVDIIDGPSFYTPSNAAPRTDS
jgi:hypothetical protein